LSLPFVEVQAFLDIWNLSRIAIFHQFCSFWPEVYKPPAHCGRAKQYNRKLICFEDSEHLLQECNYNLRGKNKWIHIMNFTLTSSSITLPFFSSHFSIDRFAFVCLCVCLIVYSHLSNFSVLLLDLYTLHQYNIWLKIHWIVVVKVTWYENVNLILAFLQHDGNFHRCWFVAEWHRSLLGFALWHWVSISSSLACLIATIQYVDSKMWRSLYRRNNTTVIYFHNFKMIFLKSCVPLLTLSIYSPWYMSKNLSSFYL
jgi:hypothetical protein